jgi:tRNA 2-thiouridine synthesizing protein A
MIEVDARGLSCPLPVLKTKQAIDRKSGDEIFVTVDQETQVENITRLATGRGFEVSVEKTGSDYRLILKPK